MKKLFVSIAIFIFILFLLHTQMSIGHKSQSRKGPQTRPGHTHPHSFPPRHGNGRIGHPVFFNPGPVPRQGWRGERRFYRDANYYVWTWNAFAPFYSWPYYYGWRIGLNYYVPEGMKCWATNTEIPGQWSYYEVYYSSDDAINSALGTCENDQSVIDNHSEDHCFIRNCVRW